ncbi:hypothetical protein KSF_109150 [Reticulibacter mediterranei]|uniref:Uncharacterized protein n=1 Tax=Reticulibacter mediterranei TaxID=2778369 RepID=A0A8J3N6Y4_9CHLR|nr:hypothetical protein KSF_109150 [Reticulibacter mediterranei]
MCLELPLDGFFIVERQVIQCQAFTQKRKKEKIVLAQERVSVDFPPLTFSTSSIQGQVRNTRLSKREAEGTPTQQVARESCAGSLMPKTVIKIRWNNEALESHNPPSIG